MASYDEYSDASFSDSAASSRDEPPTLDETLFDISLFVSFMNYMKSQQAAPSLQFLKQARLYKMLNAPRAVYSKFALQIIWTFFLDCSPMPVSVSADVKKKIKEIAFDPEAEVTLDKDVFSVAFGEVYNTVVPHFRNWISTNEWRESLPFHRIAPPSFNIVLTSGTLRVLFNKYIKSQLDHDGDGSIAHAFHLWKFCIIANDFRDGKYSHSSHLESKRKKKSDSTEDMPEKSEEGEEKPENPEEYAKRLYKKYKHQVSLPYDGSIPYAVYIIRALDHAIEEFDKSTLFEKWTSLKQYQGVDYMAKVVHQTITKDGFAEPPTLAGAMASSMLPFFLVMMKGTEAGLNLEFLVDILRYCSNFESLEEKSSSQSKGSSAGSSRSEMVDEAKRIFAKYLDSGDMYCDPHLVEEVRTAIKAGSKHITPKLFRKCGAFIYQRSEHTWAREARATFDWVIKSYDNYSQSTREVEEEFSLKNLPEGFDLQIVPSIDDVYGNPDLYKDYTQYVNERSDRLYERFLIPLREYSSSSVQTKKASLQKLMSVFSDATTIYPELTATSNLISKEVAKRECVAETVVHSVLASLIRTGAAHFYKKWLVEHSMVWKKSHWSPVAAIKFGDISLIMGMSAVETKIEEEALKGKSGFSRYLAKRQLKKQAIATIRSGASVKLPQEKAIIDTQLGIGKSEMIDPKNIDVSLAAVVPGIDDTLSSPYMRTFFQHAIMEKVLGVEQLELYKALSDFYKKYDVMSNEDLCDSQKQMLGEINEICAKYKRLLPRPDEVKERAKKQKILFPNFFRPVELDLYGRYHTAFEEGLRQKGWK